MYDSIRIVVDGQVIEGTVRCAPLDMTVKITSPYSAVSKSSHMPGFCITRPPPSAMTAQGALHDQFERDDKLTAWGRAAAERLLRELYALCQFYEANEEALFVECRRFRSEGCWRLLRAYLADFDFASGWWQLPVFLAVFFCTDCLRVEAFREAVNERFHGFGLSPAASTDAQRFLDTILWDTIRSAYMETRRTFFSHGAAGLASPFAFPLGGDHSVSSGPRDAGHGIDFGLERAFVLWELKTFSEEFLPVLLAPFVVWYDGWHEWPTKLKWCPARQSKRPKLQEWQDAVHRLNSAVPRRRAAAPAPLDAEDCAGIFRCDGQPCNEDMLLPPGEPGFTTARGRIEWEMFPLFGPWQRPREQHARKALSRIYGEQFASAVSNPSREIARRLPQIRRWLLGQLPRSRVKFCLYDYILPAVAEHDPAFAVSILDRRVARAHVLKSRASEEEKRRELMFLDGHFNTSHLCWAHVVLMQALANNRFPMIQQLLAHREIYGDSYWNDSMPQVLFAVLFHKVVALRGLGR